MGFMTNYGRKVSRYPRRRNQVGIGRPASTEWVSEVDRSFRETAPRGVQLKLRGSPAVNYASSEDLDSTSFGKAVDRRSKIEDLVDELVAQGDLGQIALNGSLSMGVRGKNFAPKRKTFSLNMRIYDTVDTEGIYPCGFTLAGEKQVIRDSLYLPYNSSESIYHLIRIGLVIDEYGFLDASAIKDIKNALPNQPVLDPISPISL